jgi:hypothetical protein
MPHNWASAELLRLVRNLLVLERGDEIHLLEGLPRSWLAPGAKTELNGAATDFGPLSLRLEVAADGASVRLEAALPASERLRRTVVHLGAWAAEGGIEREKTDTGFAWMIPLAR